MLVGIAADGEVVTVDQGIRPDTTPEGLGELKTVFKEDGVITAGNASQQTSGAESNKLPFASRDNDMMATAAANLT